MSDQQPEVRQCDTCSVVLPLTPKNFPRPRGCTTVFQTTCKKCKKKLARQKSLDRIESSAVDAFVGRVIAGGSNIPHTAELLEGLMNYFGGVNGFASIAMKQYWDSPPGSRTRSSILDMVVRLASKNTEQGGARKPIDLYSEEELEAEIDRRLEQAVLIHGGTRCIDASPSPPSAATAGLPAPYGTNHFELPEGRAADLARRADREAHGVLEALQADREAEGVSPVSDE
jgi:hypothetical protein